MILNSKKNLSSRRGQEETLKHHGKLLLMSLESHQINGTILFIKMMVLELSETVYPFSIQIGKQVNSFTTKEKRLPSWMLLVRKSIDGMPQFTLKMEQELCLMELNFNGLIGNQQLHQPAFIKEEIAKELLLF